MSGKFWAGAAFGALTAAAGVGIGLAASSCNRGYYGGYTGFGCGTTYSSGFSFGGISAYSSFSIRPFGFGYNYNPVYYGQDCFTARYASPTTLAYMPGGMGYFI